MKIQSKNEWDPLKICLVGDAINARFPTHDSFFHLHEKITRWKDTHMIFDQFPDHVIDEANEDLSGLAHTLEQLNVQVLRPETKDFSRVVSTVDWQTDGYMNYCPRDVLLVIDDLVIETPMSFRSRQDEAINYAYLRKNHIEQNGRWISAPRPRLLDDAVSIVDNKIVLSEHEPIFDAANILRLDNDILYLVSSSGNRLGARWLQNVLGDKYKVHVLDNLYASTHIDTTVTVLRPGLVVLCGERVNKNNCPNIFNGWDIIWANEMVPGPFWHYPYASKWIGMNMLSVTPDTVICDIDQLDLIKQMEQRNIQVIPLPMRHARTLGGGFHCVTLDLLRG
jgi:N-dimethylarginine dimethylaminohydrolase